MDEGHSSPTSRLFPLFLEATVHQQACYFYNSTIPGGAAVLQLQSLLPDSEKGSIVQAQKAGGNSDDEEALQKCP